MEFEARQEAVSQVENRHAKLREIHYKLNWLEALGKNQKVALSNCFTNSRWVEEGTQLQVSISAAIKREIELLKASFKHYLCDPVPAAQAQKLQNMKEEDHAAS